MEYMGKLFDELICNFLDDTFSENENVIVKQYPCRTKNGEENSQLYKPLYNAISHYTFALRKAQENVVLF